jgi:hypothetical protein
MYLEKPNDKYYETEGVYIIDRVVYIYGIFSHCIILYLFACLEYFFLTNRHSINIFLRSTPTVLLIAHMEGVTNTIRRTQKPYMASYILINTMTG